MNARRVVLAGLWLASVASAAPAPVRLSGRVIGASGKYAVYIALWHSDGFLTRPVDQVCLKPGTTMKFNFEVAPGHLALSAFEDRNGNGQLDMGVFGPREPSGFWRPFSAWRKPRFDDVRALVARDTLNADITLR